MKKAVYAFVSVIIVLTLLVQGCEIEEQYDITVINDTDSGFSVYLDDEFQFRLAMGGSSIIRNVEEGRYIIDARVDGNIIAEEVLTVDRNIEWTVYVPRYEITVVNETGFEFSVYLDGLFHFSLRPGTFGTITDILEGTHTVDARVGNEIVADETFFVDEDIEWTVY